MALKTVGLSFAGILAVFVAVASVWVIPALNIAGFRRPVETIGTNNCVVEKSLQACEKMVLHRPSGLIYASCSDLQSRVDWTPALDRLTSPKSPELDFFAIIDTSLPVSPRSIKRARLTGLPTEKPNWRGLNLVGLDVVESDTEKNVLWVYVINHRPPLPPATAKTHGADSSVEIFRTTAGSDTFEYVRTVDDPEYIVTPNDVVGLSDGSGFWVSNDHVTRVGLKREFGRTFGLEALGVTFCKVNEGCKFAITGLPGINGISRAPKEMQRQGHDIFYGAEYAGSARIFVMERQADNSLVQSDTISVGYVMDNLHIEPDGSLYVATFPHPVTWSFGGYMDDPIQRLNPASVHKVSVDPASFFGNKYQLEKVFETNGTIISGATTVVWDSKQRLLWMHGLASTGLVACRL